MAKMTLAQLIARAKRKKIMYSVRGFIQLKKRQGQRDKSSIFLHHWRSTHVVGQLRSYPVPEYAFAKPRRWRFDWAWPEQRVAVEVDGGQWAPRGGRHATDKDRDKTNHAASLGWRVLHFSPRALEADPLGSVALVQQALAWDGEAGDVGGEGRGKG